MSADALDCTAQILAQMSAAGIEAPPDRIIADGKLHRFAPAPGRKGQTGWYVVHPDPAGAVWFFGDWRTDTKERGEGDPGRVLEPAEAAARKGRLQQLRAKITAEEARFQAGAAMEAKERWDRCPPAPDDHEYLRRKGIKACGARIDGDALLIPMRDASGKLWSLQEIRPDGWKSNQEGGRRKGCFFTIGELGDTLCIGEGFSTCATIHMATGYGVMSAGEAGNVEGVALALREKYPAATIIVCGDDDWMTRVNGKSRNVGKIAATKAAKAVSGVLALPWFGPARPAWASDFNDQARQSGLDSVHDTIRLSMITHDEELQRARQAEPPPATPEDFGLPAGEDVVAFSEDALALQFAGNHLDDLCFVAKWSQWLRFDGEGRWRNDERLGTFNDARKVCRAASLMENDQKARKKLASAQTVAAVERLARSDQRLAATFDQWDRDPWLLNTPGGTVNLRTGEMREHRRGDWLTKMTAASPEGACPRWRAFIGEITGGDAELAAFIQRMLGYSLTGSTQDQCLFFLFGRGANGKSVLLSTVAAILADYHTTAPIETFTASKGERHPTELAGLQGARLVTAIETEEGRRWAEAKIKSLTGGDKISARFMRGDFFEFTPVFKLIIAGNHKPSLRTVDEAIRRRFHLVPFAVTIPPERRDPDLLAKLKAEWPGILRWMIQGCLDWQREGLNPPAAVRDATQEYLEAEDALAAWIEECAARDPQRWEGTETLFGSWSGWATRAGEHIGSQRAFSDKSWRPRDWRPAAAGMRRASKSAGSGVFASIQSTPTPPVSPV
jgi:putative DNA primase/helicase